MRALPRSLARRRLVLLVGCWPVGQPQHARGERRRPDQFQADRPDTIENARPVCHSYGLTQNQNLSTRPQRVAGQTGAQLFGSENVVGCPGMFGSVTVSQPCPAPAGSLMTVTIPGRRGAVEPVLVGRTVGVVGGGGEQQRHPLLGDRFVGSHSATGACASQRVTRAAHSAGVGERQGARHSGASQPSAT